MIYLHHCHYEFGNQIVLAKVLHVVICDGRQYTMVPYDPPMAIRINCAKSNNTQLLVPNNHDLAAVVAPEAISEPIYRILQ